MAHTTTLVPRARRFPVARRHRSFRNFVFGGLDPRFQEKPRNRFLLLPTLHAFAWLVCIPTAFGIAFSKTLRMSESSS